MTPNRLLIDVSSILRACHFVGTDLEFGRKVTFEDKQVQVNSAYWAYENFMVSYKDVLTRYGLTPRQTILVKDGHDSRSLRRAIYRPYKAKRPKSPPELNQEYADALNGVVDEITSLGGLSVHQDLMEADDVIAHLASKLLGNMIIWSRDADMLALKSDRVSVLLKDTMNPEHYESCPDTKYIRLYKTLCGDASDGFPGAKGFGPKAFEAVAMSLGADGLDELDEMIRRKELSQLSAADYPELKKVLADAQSVYTCYALAQFYPDYVNTSANPLQIEAQVMRDRCEDTHPLMEEFAGTRRLVGPADVPWLVSELRKSQEVALDIETDTPPESKEWVQKILDNSTKKQMVDIMGSYLCGMSLTFGSNMQHTVYVPVRHRDSLNLDSAAVCDIVGEIPEGAPVYIHNTAFELPVLYNEWGGWVEGAVDTAIMSSYADENEKMGLKDNTLRLFGYQQTTYEEVTTKQGPIGTLPEGGVQVKVFEKEVTPAVYAPSRLTAAEAEALLDSSAALPEFLEFDDLVAYSTPKMVAPATTETWETRQYGMSELTAAEVFAYGADDALCTAALANRLRLTLELEGCWECFMDVEQDVTYVMAQAFVDGIEVDYDKLARLEAADRAEYARLWQEIVRPYLVSKNWAGCDPPTFQNDPAGIKAAFEIITGRTLDCRARLPEKIIAAVREQGCEELAEALESAGDVDSLIQAHYVCEPDFSVSKSADLRKLFFEVMGLPIRFRTVPTPTMRSKGIREGAPQADASAIEHILALDLAEGSAEAEVVKAVRDMKACETRQGLYYTPYPLYAHWLDGKIHANPGQSRTVTRRASPNAVNIAQMPKKRDGGKIRSVFIAPEGYTWVSMDFAAQEIRLAAWASQDESLLSCFIGENKKDPHSLTGAGIAAARQIEGLSDYETFCAEVAAGNKEAKQLRALGKGINFGTQYLVRAPKLAKMLVCDVADAEMFITTKNKTFPQLAQWQQDTIALARAQGYVATMVGDRRHLQTALTDPDKWKQGDAERQAVSMIIQGSAASMTKLASARMRRTGVLESGDVSYIFPVHDEVNVLCRTDVLEKYVPLLHECMTQPYADMGIPVESDVSLGHNFGELISLGVEPTLEKIQETRGKLLTT